MIPLLFLAAPSYSDTTAAVASAAQDGELRTAHINGDRGWREDAERRIDQHRKAVLEVNVANSDGDPIPDATVVVKMKRHSFQFGALAARSRWEDRPNAEDARRHRALFDEYFNAAVTIPRPGERASDYLLNWMKERQVDLRGHYLMWAPIQPGRERGGQPQEVFNGVGAREMADRYDELDKDRIREAAFSHLEKVLTFVGDRAVEWDAVNHIANANHFRYSDLFGTQIYADVIKRGRELAPHAQMWVNEGNVLTAGLRLETYHQVIAELIKLDAKPDGIGFMAHFREGGFTPPEEIYARLDRFAELVPNLKLTELDIDTTDEQFQAEYMADILTVVFSHPAVSGIILWQVWGASVPTKTLWNEDWTIKPAGEAWVDHVFNRWWTDESGTTDGAGSYATRGFLGDYEISVEVGSQTRTVLGSLAPGGARFDLVF
jgi:endo-1,4-beta-xylanase